MKTLVYQTVSAFLAVALLELMLQNRKSNILFSPPGFQLNQQMYPSYCRVNCTSNVVSMWCKVLSLFPSHRENCLFSCLFLIYTQCITTFMQKTATSKRKRMEHSENCEGFQFPGSFFPLSRAVPPPPALRGHSSSSVPDLGSQRRSTAPRRAVLVLLQSAALCLRPVPVTQHNVELACSAGERDSPSH